MYPVNDLFRLQTRTVRKEIQRIGNYDYTRTLSGNVVPQRTGWFRVNTKIGTPFRQKFASLNGEQNETPDLMLCVKKTGHKGGDALPGSTYI